MAQPIVSGSAASGAYRISRSLAAGAAEPAAAEDAKRSSFTQMLGDAALKAAEDVRAADKVAQAGLAGKVPTQQVIESTMALEHTVKVTVAMRDKLVEAYQEIMRMPI